MIEILTQDHEDTVAIRMSRDLTTEDYEPVVAILEDKIQQHGRINLYCEVEELEDVEAGAIWKDLKFDAKHFNDFKRVAMVGDKQWLEWGAKFAKPFTSAEVRYFDRNEKADAMNWVVSEEHTHH